MKRSYNAVSSSSTVPAASPCPKRQASLAAFLKPQPKPLAKSTLTDTIRSTSSSNPKSVLKSTSTFTSSSSSSSSGSPVKKLKLDAGILAPIVIDGSDDDGEHGGTEGGDVNGNEIRSVAGEAAQAEEASLPVILNKGKAKAELATGEHPELDLDTPWPPAGHPYHPPPHGTFNHPIVCGSLPDSLQRVRYNVKPRIIHNPTTDLDLIYYKGFIDPKTHTPSTTGSETLSMPSSKELMKYLLEELPWYRVKYMVRGININTPRFTTVFGKDSTDIPWTGYMKAKPRAIPEVLVRLMRKVEQVTDSQFNFCLVNYYSSGDDSISFHSDSESFLGPEPSIASLSLGQPRDFHLRHINHRNHPRTGKPVPVEKFVLEDGDMVLMKGRTQHEWQHSIPKRKGDHVKGRINITFRKGVVRYATENYYNYNVGKGEMYRWDSKAGKMIEVA